MQYVKMICWVPLAIAVLMAAALPLAAGEGGLDRLEGLVGELIAVQKARYEAENSWHEQQPVVEARRRLLAAERDAVRRELETARADETATADARQTSETAAAAQKQTVQALEAPLERAEALIRSLSALLPEPLQDRLEEQSAEHSTGDQNAGGPGDLAERLRQICGKLSEIEQFSDAVHLLRQRLADPGGEMREMDVLYLGLGAAFAVSPGGTLAAAGRPSPDGWQWRWDPGIAEPVRNAVAVFRKERPAGFVHLPLSRVVMQAEASQ